MRGRRPVPTAIKEIRGHPGHRPKNEAEPVLAPAELSQEPPRNLSPEAVAIWHEYIPELLAKRVLTKADVPIFAMYCSSYAEWQKYDAEMPIKGPYTFMRRKNSAGEEVGDIYTFWNPARTIRNEARDATLRLAAELGLSPSSRSRVKVADGGSMPGDKAKRSSAEVRRMLQSQTA